MLQFIKKGTELVLSVCVRLHIVIVCKDSLSLIKIIKHQPLEPVKLRIADP